MEQPEQDSVGIHNSNGGSCDESKCVSKGRANLFNDSNTCYGDDGTFFPMMCADGFLPVIVEDEPPSIDSSWYGDIPVSYFTCCPPYEITSNSTSFTRQCSDPIIGTIDIEYNYNYEDDENIATACEGNIDKYPRQMKTSWGILAVGTFGITPSKTDSYLCCDSNDDDNGEVVAENFLDDLECVPYRNEVYEYRRAQNLVGILRVITCDFPEGDFVFPRPVGEGTYGATGQFQCCKNGPALPPFIQDSAFKITVYLPMAIWCVAAAASALVCIALLIPLAKQLRNGTQRRNTQNSSYSRMKVPFYSTYNMYLMGLAFFDLVYSLFQIGWYGSYINQKFNPNFYSVVASPTNLVYTVTIIRAPDGPITYAYVFINMWINTIISFQLLALLKKSKRAQKISQPSIRRVTLQVGAIFLLSIIYGYILYALSAASTKAGKAGDFETVERLSSTVQVLWILMLILPIACISVICFLIWWGDFIPTSLESESSTRDKAMRQLFFFFLRIVAVFYCIFVPAMVILIVGVVKFTPWYFLLSWCLLAFQPILSTCMLFTKFDVKKYILDLVTLSYVFDTNRTNSLNWSSRLAVSTGGLNSTKFSRGRMSSIGTLGASPNLPTGRNNVEEEGVGDDESSLLYSVMGFRLTTDNNGVTQTDSN